MPLKFFYPTWKNGERVSGTLDGAGYYKLLRYVLNISERLTKYILFYVRYHCLPAIRNVNNGSLDEQTWQQVFIPDQFKHFLPINLGWGKPTSYNKDSCLSQVKFWEQNLSTGFRTMGWQGLEPQFSRPCPIGLLRVGSYEGNIQMYHINHIYFLFSNLFSPILCLRIEPSWWTRLTRCGTSTSHQI